VKPVSVDTCAASWHDWWRGTRNVDLWLTLAWYDIVLRYRRSILGPLWLTLSMGLMLLGVGPLYAALTRVPLSTFFPYITLGLTLWIFLVGAINEGCLSFINAAAYLKQADYPGSVFVWRTLTRNVIQFMHFIVLYVPIAIWAGIRPSPTMLLAIPGFLVVLINLHAASITLGILCARFRDVPQIVTSVLQVMMFLTPVFWLPESLPPGRLHVVLFNPLAHALSIVRDPLLAALPPRQSIEFFAVFTCVNVGLAAVVFHAKRRQVVFWL